MWDRKPSDAAKMGRRKRETDMVTELISTVKSSDSELCKSKSKKNGVSDKKNLGNKNCV